MKIKIVVFLFLTMLLTLLAGCDPTPYDLTVRVTDENGDAIPSAIIILDELGDMQATDDAGEITWADLENEVANLIIAAQGYESRTVEVTLERGRNEEVVALERAIPPADPSNP